jgi:hypothetical protein
MVHIVKMRVSQKSGTTATHSIKLNTKLLSPGKDG